MADYSKVERKKLNDEKKKLKIQKRNQKKDVKRRAKEIAAQEALLAEDEEGGGFFTFLATLAIIAVWIGIVCVVIKLDVGGFGSGVLAPILKDVPVVNKILPTPKEDTDVADDDYAGYTSIRDAVEQIRSLETQLQQAKSEITTKDEEIATLKAEVVRLQDFEEKQIEFQSLKTKFFNDVVYSEKGPGVEAFIEWYEAMDPTTAEYLYKQAIAEQQEDAKVQEYADAYSSMKPARAAAIFEEMPDNLNLVARILMVMEPSQRGDILAQMSPDFAAKLTKIMDPES